MQQYNKVKSKYPDAILLFRVGDFYETFGPDAEKAAGILGIILTKRNNGGVDVALAGFPYHSLDNYLPRLVRAGYRVAICEQLEKPSKEKKIVRRGVTEVVTPGVAINDKLLDHKSNNFLAAVHFSKKGHFGLAFLDVSTGEFLVSEGNQAYVDKMLQGFKPSEVIFPKGRAKEFEEVFGKQFYTFLLDEWVYTPDYTREKLIEQFEVKTLKGFGIEELEDAQIAAGAILHYVATTENTNLKHINNIARIQPDKYVWLDRFTIRNLELVYSNHDTGVPLIDILDETISPMGARLLKMWVVLPLKNQIEIQARQEVVTYFLDSEDIRKSVETNIKLIGDLERLISKVPLGKINPREIVQVKRALEAIAPIKEQLSKSTLAELKNIGERLNPCPVLREQIQNSILEDPPVNLHKGGVMADGLSEELDHYRNLINNAKDLLIEVQQREIARTGIENLKIGFNNVFGYFLEVTNKYKNKGLIPDDWTRKQTLTNAERYITEELKKLESEILGAEEKSLALEVELFNRTVAILADYIEDIQRNAQLIARIDCLISFANVAIKNKYVLPEVNDSLVIDIKNGRHPVIEKHLPIDESYIPNDVFLDNDSQQIMMITGPNMSGKSAVLRQTALICLMAQIGSYVPADEASIGYIDKIFTRVGASDNISSGESTFMVEMNETASIMNNVSDRSLILLDEIGRGTSTYDGISIAWSIAEYLHNHQGTSAKTLFATHYHELNELAGKFPRIKNFCISTKEVGQKVIFLRKLIQGGSNHSFGIHVAKMAGMPRSIVERASHILAELEESKGKIVNKKGNQIGETLKNMPAETMQLSIFETVDKTAGEIKAKLSDIELNAMTPIDCMLKLKELKEILEKN